MNRETIKNTMLLAMSEHHSGNIEEAQRIVDAILAAIEAAGVRLVPVKMTPDMHRAGMHERMQQDGKELPGEAASTGDIYAAMLAASPYAPGDSP